MVYTGEAEEVEFETDAYKERAALYSCLQENTTAIKFGSTFDFQIYDFDEDTCNTARSSNVYPSSTNATGQSVCAATELYYYNTYADLLGDNAAFATDVSSESPALGVPSVVSPYCIRSGQEACREGPAVGEAFTVRSERSSVLLLVCIACA